MASDNEASCESDPNFAVICAFMEKFGATCGLASIDFLELQEMLENTQEVPQELIDLHIKLLRKSRKTVSNERWEKAIIKFCHSFCVQDAWEIERFGYKKARLSSKLRVLKELLEMQFDYNARFKAEINKMSAEELRSQPLGKDKQGHAYWFQNDNNCQIRVYKEDPDEETWTLVAKDRDGLIALINELSNGDADSKAIAESVINEEDSNSLVEKPIIDTGQVDSSSSESNKKSGIDESENSNESKKDISEENGEESPVDEEVEGEDEKSDKKRTRESDDEKENSKRARLEEDEVGEAVEEPMMLVKGEGNGVENECENPIVGEEIEEDLMYFYGSGNGADCETGNEDGTKEAENKSADTLTLSGDNNKDGVASGSDGSENCVSINVIKGGDSKNCIDEDCVDAGPREVPTSPVKSPFKLGTIIDTKTDNKFFNAGKSHTKKSSRWDVETIIAKEPPPIEEPVIINTEEEVTTPKKSMFFFGPGCLQFKPNVSPVSCSATVAFGQKVPQTDAENDVKSNTENQKTIEISSSVEEEKNDVGYRIGGDSVETSECVQSSEEVVGPVNDQVSDEKVEGTLLVDQQTPLESSIENKLNDIEDKNDETKANRQEEEDVHRQQVTEEAKIEEEQEIQVESEEKPVEIIKEEKQETFLVKATKDLEEQEKEVIIESPKTTEAKIVEEEVAVESTKSTEEKKEEVSSIEVMQNTEEKREDSLENIEEKEDLVAPATNIEEEKGDLVEPLETIEGKQKDLVAMPTNVDKEKEDLVASTENIEEEKEALMAPSENVGKDEEDLVTLTKNIDEEKEDIVESSSNTEEEKKDFVAPSEIIEEEEEDSVALIKNVEEENDDLVASTKNIEKVVQEESLLEKTTNIEEESSKEVSMELKITIEEEKIQEVIEEEENSTLPKDKNENISSKEPEKDKEDIKLERIIEPQKESEVSFLSDMEKQIVPEDEICEPEIKIDSKIPEVTAALVECDEKIEPQHVQMEEEQLKPMDLTNDSSCVADPETGEEKESKPIPVIEEECVKKHSYLLGGETETDIPVEKSESTDYKNNEQCEPEVNIPETQESSVKTTEPCDIPEELSTIEEETKDMQQQQQPEEVLNLSAAKEKSVSENQETVIKNEIEQEKNVREEKEEEPPVLEEVQKKEEDQTVKEPTNNNKRGRKNNASDQPKIITRRSTRSSRNEESAKAAEEPPLLVEEEKKVELSAKIEDTEQQQSTTMVQPRRGRSRGMTKVEKEEVPDMDNSKKMKMSDEVVEDSEIKPSKQTKNKLKESNSSNEEEKKPDEEEIKPELVNVESGNSSDGADFEDRDPLAVSDEEVSAKEDEEKKAPMSLSTFSLDFHESLTPTPPVTRSGRRKRGRESPPNSEDVDETAGKRLKKGKRNIDVKLRKSIEEQKKQELISSDDDKQQQVEETPTKNSKKKGNKHKKADQVKNEEPTLVSSDAETPKETEPVQKKTKTVNKNKRLLSNLGIDPDQPLLFKEEAVIGVRQSRRIAQLKIKEEAERRKLEEEMANEHLLQQSKKKKSKKHEDKDYKVKKSKNEAEDDDDVQEEDSTDSKKRKKKKKKKHKKLFDEFNPWRSSSDSSTTDEEEEDEIVEEEDDEVLQYISDHEFSPESDLEGDGEAQPLKRARTVRKESDVEEEVDDCPCQKCGKSDHPEWILLCDRCDNGWHCSCLRPPLLVIPEGDWFCPPCQHGTLLRKLQEKLKDYDKKLSKKEIEDRRKQRLAYVGISLNNVLPTKETDTIKKRRLSSKDEDEDGDDDDAEDDDAEDELDEEEEESEESPSGSASETGSESDEPIYQLRQRRQAHSYRFNDYDELINSAIQDEMEAVKGAGNQGRGKDIATIVNAEKEEERKKEEEENGTTVVEETTEDPEPPPPVVPPDDRDKEAKPLYSDDEPVIGVKKKIAGRKKHRKLNSLDISSADDDEDSDEDFKGTSDESDDDFDEDLGSEDSDDLDSGRNRRRNTDPVRRSTRARTSRYDADFIDDGDSEDEDEAPRRKKKRSIWDESESEESDRSWGRRKRKPPANRKKNTNTTTSLTNKKKKSKKKKKKNEDSDAEVYRKKKPKIKFGLEGEEEGPGRRTRGKKINYVDALGSDSDEDRVKRPPPRIESEEEYVANEDDDVDEDDKVTDEEESGEEHSGVIKSTGPKVQIQSYADARFTQLLPEGVPTPKDLYVNNQPIRDEDGEDEPNPIDQINRNVEMMDENEMEKMMEEEEYANKQLQMVAMQLEKEKRRKEREAKKLEGLQPASVVVQTAQQLEAAKKRAAMRKAPIKGAFQFSGAMQEPIVGNVDSLIVNADNNDELSEPPGVSLPMFAELGGPGVENLEDPAKKRRARSKKSLEEAVANLGTVRQQQESGFLTMSTNNNKNLPTDLSSTQQDSNIEIAAPPQPFSQSQPTPSVITRMLQSKPGQPGYPVGTIRPKQFASLSEREDEGVPPPTSGPPVTHHSMSPVPAHHGQYLQGAPMRPQLPSPYRQLPPTMNHYPPRGAPLPSPHQIRNPVQPPHLYHSHRSMDPSPSGGGAISIADHHNSPGRVVSPASSSPGGPTKNETPPPPYSRPPPVSRFPLINTTSITGPRHIPMVAPPQHLQAPRPNLSPYHPSMPPSYHYGQFGGQPIPGGTEDAMPPTVYQSSPYSEQFSNEGQVNPSENSNSKSFDDESGGEFGGLVSYFSSQREDDLES